MKLLVATRKGLFTVGRRAAGAWEIEDATFLGDNVSMAMHDPRSGMTFAALDHGHFGVKMHRRQGTTWQEVSSPAYPPKPEDCDETDMWGRPLPWSTVRVWALEAGGEDEPGLLWCGTIPGGLFKSRDDGATWEIVDPLWRDPKRRQWMGGGADLPGLHSILVDPRASKAVTVAVSTGGLWHTEDGGDSWSQRGAGMRADHVPPELTHDPIAQDVHCLAQCRAAPDRMWVQHHNGIFVSSDRGRNFEELRDVSPSAFGFAVVAHPRDPDTAWFVPEIKDEKRIPVDGRLAVIRTRDAGRSFETLTRGLPQQHAYDVVYRHALALDPEGDVLAFGSTTGSLWLSEDQGDSWSAVSQTLPPIYCVRFM